MALESQQSTTLRTGWLRILLTVALNVVLALVLVCALVWLAGRPGLHQRLDLTAEGENTLDENALAVIDALPGEVSIDFFTRAFDAPLHEIGAQIHGRMFEILILAEAHAPDKISFTHHPYAPRGAGGAELEAKMRELGLGESNTLVISSGNRRVQVKLLGEVAEVDLGNPFGQPGQHRPPSITSFAGQEALVKGLLRVTQGEKSLVLFAQGHREREAFDGEDPRAMGRLHSALVADGFRAETWDPERDGPVPEGCAVLAIIGSEEPFSLEATGWIADYVRSGGSIIAAPGLQLPGGQGSVAGVLMNLGMLVQPGLICRPVMGAGGQPLYETARCADILVRAENMLAQHAITESLRRGDRRVRFAFTRSLVRAKPPKGGVVLDLLNTSEFTWEEFPNPDGSFSYIYDEGKERTGPFTLAMTSTFPPAEMGPQLPPSADSVRRECRVLGVGAPDVFANGVFDTNRDFLVNAFNWAANREFRVSITPKARQDRRIDIGEDRTLFYLNLVAIWCLPLLSLAIGIFAAWRRRR